MRAISPTPHAGQRRGAGGERAPTQRNSPEKAMWIFLWNILFEAEDRRKPAGGAYLAKILVSQPAMRIIEQRGGFI
jgi:hypothetical protein